MKRKIYSETEVIQGMVEFSKTGLIIPICRHCKHEIKLKEVLWQDPKHYKKPKP